MPEVQTGSTSPGPARLTVDVAVVGAGGAGLAAAVQAAAKGARVVVLESNDRPGGTTAMSVGSITASRTSLQQQAGIEDDLDEHAEDMLAFAGSLRDRDNPALRRLYVENSGPTFEWLRRLGIVFLGPMEEPPHRRPRMHNVLPGSKAYVHRLARIAMQLGVEIRTRTRAEGTLRDGDRIVGLRARGPSGEVEIHARGGVILAAGDFSASVPLKREYLGELEATVPAINDGSHGDGVALGVDAGGTVLNGDLALGPELRFVEPPHRKWFQRIPPYRFVGLLMKLAATHMPDALMRRVIMAYATTWLAPTPRVLDLGALLIDSEGDLVAGDSSGSPAHALAGRPRNEGWLLLDAAAAERLSAPPNHVSTAPGIAYAYLGDYRNSRQDIYHHAPSMQQLAVDIGVDPASLAASLETVNAQRPSELRCDEGPYIALGPVRSWIVLTDGGLAIDTSCRVLAEGGSPIPGLYAAGSNGQGGLLLEGHGNHIGWAFVSGRIAGNAAAAAAIDQTMEPA